MYTVPCKSIYPLGCLPLCGFHKSLMVSKFCLSSNKDFVERKAFNVNGKTEIYKGMSSAEHQPQTKVRNEFLK